MLSTIGLRHPSPGYYLADHHGELPLELGPRPDGWWGRQADVLGLRGRAGPEEMAALCAGRLPAGPRMHQREVLAYDLTFAAPKEASLLLAADDERASVLLAAHGHAVLAALGYVQDRAASVVVGVGDAREPGRVAGIAVHASTHASSRAGEPHLHTHCLTANAGQGPDGRFRALDGRGLRAHAKAADALYRAELSYQLLERLGPPTLDLPADHRLALRAAFSSRSAQLAEGGRREGPAGAEPRATQLARWRLRLSQLGVEANGEHLRSNAVDRPHRRIDEHGLASSLLGDDLRRSRRDLVEAWAKAAGPVPAAEVLASVDRLLGGRDLAVGIGEEVLMPHRVLASKRALQRLGARPSRAEALGEWMRRAAVIERGRGRHDLEHPGRGRARA